MSRIQVTLPDAATEFIQTQLSSGQFSSPSEYLGFLVEQARATAAKQTLDELRINRPAAPRNRPRAGFMAVTSRVG